MTSSSSSSSSHASFKYLMIFVYKSSPLILYINTGVVVSENEIRVAIRISTTR